MKARRRSLALLAAAALAAAPAAPGCTFQSLKRETDTTGTFRTEAISFDFLLFFRLPWNPRLRAMELARDTWGENLRVVRYSSYPEWGFFNFLNGLVIGWSGAIVEGEYGIPPDTAEGRAAFQQAKKARGPAVDVDGSPITPIGGGDR